MERTKSYPRPVKERIDIDSGTGHQKSSVEELLQNKEGECEFAKEGFAFEATELISELMDREHVNKAELARRLGRSRAHVTQLLGGSRNMTMHTFAEILFALEYKGQLNAVPLIAGTSETDWTTLRLPAQHPPTPEPPREQRGGSASFAYVS